MSEIPIYSELIFRFLDGDTSEIEQGMLFNELSQDANLQTEFQQAIATRQAILVDVRRTAIPAALTDQIKRAGFKPIASTASIISSTSTTKGGHTWTLLLVLLSALGGAGLTYHFGATREQVFAPIGEITTKFLESASTSGQPASTGVHTLAAARSKPVQAIAQERTLESAIEPRQMAPSSDTRGEEAPISYSKDDGKTIIPCDTRQVEFNRVEKAAFHDLVSHTELSKNPLGPIEDQAGDLSVRISREIPINKTVRDPKPSIFTDVNVGVQMAINQEEWIVAKFGQEGIPVFVHREASLIDRNSVRWIGIGYGHRFVLLPNAGISAQAEATIGGALTGPLAKASAGLEWAFGKFSTLTSLESTTVTLQNNGDWDFVERLGLNIGFTYLLGR